MQPEITIKKHIDNTISVEIIEDQVKSSFNRSYPDSKTMDNKVRDLANDLSKEGAKVTILEPQSDSKENENEVDPTGFDSMETEDFFDA